METKKCSHCKKEHELKEFVKTAKSKDGLSYRCSGCRRESRNKKKKKIVAYNKQYRIDNREKRRLYNIDYISKNEEKMKIAKKKYREENLERLKKKQKE